MRVGLVLNHALQPLPRGKENLISKAYLILSLCLRRIGGWSIAVFRRRIVSMSLRQISLSYQTIEYTLLIRDFPPDFADSDTDWLICTDRLRLADGRSLESYKRRVQRMREEVIAKHSKGSRRVPGAK